MKKKNYPKVLLLCNYSQNSANGITINNLFKSWPKGKLRVVDFSENTIDQIYVDHIDKYYCLGDKEIRYPWPFNYFRKPPKSKCYDLELYELKEKKKISGKLSLLKKLTRNYQLWFLNKTGLVFVSRKINISNDLQNFIQDFNPDIIYSSMCDITRLRFFKEVIDNSNASGALHVFDDFINSRYERTLSPKFWERKFKEHFINALSVTDIPIAISNKMASEYEDQFNRKFYSFHNPIDPEIWVKKGEDLENKMNNSNKSFLFVYAGKINDDTIQPIKSFIRVIRELNSENEFNLEFNIYSPYDALEIERLLGRDTDIYFKGKAPYDDLIHIFKSADGLLLPLADTKKTIKYIRLSMLTKVTEYMISGTPILTYAPRKIAVTEYLKKHDASFFSYKEKDLKSILKEFIKNDMQRKTIAVNAYQCAVKNHLQPKVSEKLRSLFNKKISNN